MAEIRVDPQFLVNLANRIQQAADELRSFSSRGESNLASAPEVAEAYRNFGQKWDQRRNELADALAHLADSFLETRNKFMATDSALAADLQQEK